MKRRWLQFSLRGLLGVAALVCLLLGGWHLFVTYGNWVDAENPRVGAPIRVKGRGILPDDCEMVLGYYRADEPGCVEKHFRGEKSWLGLYSAEYELDPVDRPCQIVVYLGFYDGSDSWIGKEKTVDVK